MRFLYLGVRGGVERLNSHAQLREDEKFPLCSLGEAILGISWLARNIVELRERHGLTKTRVTKTL